jgi:hypothetical protein
MLDLRLVGDQQPIAGPSKDKGKGRATAQDEVGESAFVQQYVAALTEDLNPDETSADEVMEEERGNDEEHEDEDENDHGERAHEEHRSAEESDGEDMAVSGSSRAAAWRFPTQEEVEKAAKKRQRLVGDPKVGTVEIGTVSWCSKSSF